MSRFALTLGLAVMFVAGCAEPGAGLDPFPGDGISAYGPAAAVDVCIGSAHAIPGGAASLCMAAGTAALACDADSACDAPERCLCGRCIVRACDTGSVCPSGEACRGGRCTRSCTTDPDCDPGEACSGGGCTHACDADTDCHRGEICGFLGTCEATPCGPAVACGAGQTCEPVAIDGDVREPSVVTLGDTDVFFFELRSAEGSSIYRATARDPLHFKADPPTPVLVADAPGTRVGAPSAVARGGEGEGSAVDLFVSLEGGASIGLATSGDGGRTFKWVGTTLLTPSEPWEKGAVGSPGAFERDGTTFVFYEGGAGAGIGLAKLQGDVLERVSSAPVMRPSDLEDATFWRSVKALGTPFAQVEGSAIRVFVTANGIEAGTAVTEAGPVPAQPNDSIGIFATLDLATFDRYPTGPVYQTTGGLFGSLGEREPAVRRTAAGADLYFVATDASGAASSGLSAASTQR